ncbi:tetratricopeptide repeat protein [Desulfovibrio sulfodismutans]|uniref:Tetratricopeptide repeat protein n=1 Tax=Desulfolutivibrio sulfodismutans TaxID=63561 RepID=A0A7K3NPW8_9BACT|nr:tetratricopeptide repeat protein [Desulfolutivibrio sulfodismutans]NDY58256.1 tetratricopeptide repeat protein [Desulfolutivibrio sulfodismutans]QLA14149.1 tetratricopeptide repeat protein [Desulfolutivibrio sulfodismutans DSM 3696]
MADKDELFSVRESGGEKHQPSGKAHDRIKGVFSTQAIQRVGTGTTTRKTIQKMYWFVEELGDKLLEIQPLNKNYVPSGPKRKITVDELLEKFSPEPEFYVSTVYPKMRELNMTIVKGEKHRSKGEIFSAELEFGQALAVDEENVRANFGLGLTYLDRGEANKAQDIFERLVRLDAAFDKEHKHLFNEFGINLRKNKMLDQALDYYKRAEDLTQSDENLLYNIARAFFEKKNIEQCFEYLKKALDINPDLMAAKKFITYLVEKNLLPGQVASDIIGSADTAASSSPSDPESGGPISGQP